MLSPTHSSLSVKHTITNKESSKIEKITSPSTNETEKSQLFMDQPRFNHNPKLDRNSTLPTPSSDGIGNLIGPRHPDWRRTINEKDPRFSNDDDTNHNWGLPEPLPNGSVPPGAKFDPFGPPGPFPYK